MSTATIYATALHKQKEQYGCYGISILKDKARKTKDYTGQFPSESKTASQLSALVYAISLVKDMGDVEEIHLISDLSLIEKIYNGTIDEWERNDWKKANNLPVSQSELWKEIFDLMQVSDLTFSPVGKNDGKMDNIIKLCKSETRKTKNLKPLFKGALVEEKIESPVEVAKEMPVAKVTEMPKESKKKKVEKVLTVEAETLRFEETTAKTSGNAGVITVDAQLKSECDLLFREIGLDLDTAVNLFLKHSLRKKGLTLDLKLDEN